VKCHRVGDEGKQVGPELSEIGSKLAPEAIYVSILDPSAAVSFNFETYNVLLKDGRNVSGVLVSQTDDSVTIKTAEAIERTFQRAAIDEFVKQPISLMPSDLVRNMTTQQLVDLVAYLMSLKKS
jgi:putative heme-binding domain-containing protein